MLDYTNITTILCKPLIYNHLQYEYAINSTECSQYASREEIFVIINDIMPAYRVKLVELLQYSAPFLAVIPEYRLYELKKAPTSAEDIRGLLSKLKTEMIDSTLKDKSETNSKKIKKNIENIALHKLFNDKGEYIG